MDRFPADCPEHCCALSNGHPQDRTHETTTGFTSLATGCPWSKSDFFLLLSLYFTLLFIQTHYNSQAELITAVVWFPAIHLFCRQNFPTAKKLWSPILLHFHQQPYSIFLVYMKWKWHIFVRFASSDFKFRTNNVFLLKNKPDSCSSYGIGWMLNTLLFFFCFFSKTFFFKA